MTTITILASGTRGDVQPYLALGAGLKRAGYEIRMLASDDFAPLAAEAGLAFRSTGESVEAMLQSEEWRAVAESGNFLRILGRMRAEMRRRGGEAAARLPELLDGTDLLLAGMGGLGGGFAIARQRGIPILQAYLFPFAPTSQFASPLAPRLSLGGPLNRLSFSATRQLFWQTSKLPDQLIRRQLGMVRGPFGGPFRELDRLPALYGYSPAVLPRPADWPERFRVAGYWFLDEPAGWAPPPALEAFLDAGEPPVYIGFGSMGSRDPREAGRIALEALALTGQRGILAAGWGGLTLDDLPDNVHLISSIYHSWLFPRMRAVVHHGGAGTTAAGLRAGAPSVIVPFMGDQPFWGRRVADLGAGPAPIPRKQLTAERLAAA
ncbi:MAG TPA: glycosyltransferase, partial [Herpetosiphonaceae bacterium]